MLRAVGRTRKADTIDKIASLRKQLTTSFEGLSANQMLERLPGGWSVKDIVTHVTSWEELILLDLRRIQHGRQPARYHASNDTWNPVLMNGRQAFSLDQVLAEFVEVHHAVVNILEALDDSLIPGDVTGICNVLAFHDWEHTTQINVWRKQMQI